MFREHRGAPVWALLVLIAGVVGAEVRAEGPGDAAAASAASEPEAAPAEASADAAAGSQPDELELSLNEAIRLGLERNLDLEIERHGPLIAEEEQKISWGAYDPTVSGSIGYNSTTAPVSNALFANRSFRGDGNIGLGGLIPLVGGAFDVQIQGVESNNFSPVTTLRPAYDTAVSVELTLPLLKGLIWNEPWTRVKTTALLRGVADESFRLALMDTVTAIEAAYWNLVASREQWRVARKSLETAEALLDQVRTQYEVGVVSKVEVVEAEAGVAEREVNVIVAENTFRTAQDRLIDAVFGPRLTATSRLEVQTTDAPDAYVPYEVDVAAALERALAQRPELRIAESQVEQAEVSLKYARNQWLPQLDIVGGYSATGLSGDERPSFFGSAGPDDCQPDGTNCLRGTLGDSFDNISESAGGDVYDIRAVLSVPLGSYGTRHSVSKAQLEVRRAEQRLARTRQSIVFEIRDRARALVSAQQGIAAADRRRSAAQEQLRAERIRLEHGESTPFDVLQRERDLVDAESQRIASLQVYRTSAADLLRAQGTTLEARNILIDDARGLR